MWIKLGGQTATVLTKEGERLTLPVANPIGYEDYFKTCMEFLDFAFTPIQERERREQAKLQQQAEIEAEISRIQRTIGIISSKAPTAVAESEMTFSEEKRPEINEVLQKTADHLSSIKKLLSSI